MTDKTLTLTVTGDQAVVDDALDAFARHHGWVEQVTDSNGITINNPVSKLQQTENVLRAYIAGGVQEFRKVAAAEAALAAAEAATGAALDTIILGLSEA